MPYPLTNFEIQKKYYQNKLRFNGIFLKYKLPKIKDGTYVIGTIGTHWIALYVHGIF